MTKIPKLLIDHVRELRRVPPLPHFVLPAGGRFTDEDSPNLDELSARLPFDDFTVEFTVGEGSRNGSVIVFRSCEDCGDNSLHGNVYTVFPSSKDACPMLNWNPPHEQQQHGVEPSLYLGDHPSTGAHHWIPLTELVAANSPDAKLADGERFRQIAGTELWMARALNQLLQMLSVESAEMELVDRKPTRNQRRKGARQKPSYRVVVIKAGGKVRYRFDPYSDDAPARSVRGHHRRGHVRTLASGKRIFIRPAYVRGRGHVDHVYNVEGDK
jgi:hypothetical protein